MACPHPGQAWSPPAHELQGRRLWTVHVLRRHLRRCYEKDGGRHGCGCELGKLFAGVIIASHPASDGGHQDSMRWLVVVEWLQQQGLAPALRCCCRRAAPWSASRWVRIADGSTWRSPPAGKLHRPEWTTPRSRPWRHSMTRSLGLGRRDPGVRTAEGPDLGVVARASAGLWWADFSGRAAGCPPAGVCDRPWGARRRD